MIHQRAARMFSIVACATVLAGCQSGDGKWSDPAAHQTSVVTVAPGIDLEVLDWGGSGPPLVFLAGLGNTAHAYDDFAPRFVDQFRVVAITRRGFGASSHPDSGYDARTLGSDVSSVLRSMQLDRAILAGHSIAAIELTAMGTHHADQVRKLVYLDTYCNLPAADSVWQALVESPPAGTATPVQPGDADTLTASGYVSFVHRTRGVSIPEADIRIRYAEDGWNEELGKGFRAVFAALETQPCTSVRVPALAIIASRDAIDQEEPHIRADTAAWPAQREVERRLGTMIEMVRADFAAVSPAWRVEVIRGGHHWVFVSHADEVERLMREFLR